MKKELRTSTITFRNEGNSRRVEGYACVFNQASEPLPFIETISPEAIDQDLINRSDIFATFNHDEKIVYARSKRGKGSLNLSIDEHGLKYSFDAPKTAAGDELLEHLRRGEITQSSFAFYMDPDDPTCEQWEERDGQIYRTINKIFLLADVSPVWTPAYSGTEVSTRSMEIYEKLLNERAINNKTENNEDEDEQKNKSDEQDDLQDRSTSSTENQENEERDEPQDSSTNNDDEDQDEQPRDSSANDDNKENDETPDEKESDSSSNIGDNENDSKPDDEENTNKRAQINNKIKKTKNKESKRMSKNYNFSILKAIRNIANGQPLNAMDQAVINDGVNEFTRAGLSRSGQIQLNLEKRVSPITVTSEGEDVVVTDFTNILEPLLKRNVLVQAGANFITGLTGNVQIPTMGAENVTWEGEVAAAKDGAPSFEHLTLSPKRITAYVDLSKQFIIQDTLGAEELIRKYLIEAVNQKLEDTILSDGVGTATQPAGIFNGKVATALKTFKNICDFEASVEEKNVYGDMKYIVNPKAKAALRNMALSTKSTALVWENNEVNGVPAFSTTHMGDNLAAYGDFSNVTIGQWGGLDLTVDPYTKAADGQVRIVINAYFDFKLVRPDAVVLGTTAD